MTDRADFTVRNLSCPLTVMDFYLVFSGKLPSSGNSAKPEDVRNIRDQLHPQMEFLWKTNATLNRLRWTARVPKDPGWYLSGGDSPFIDRDEPPPELPEGWVNLIEPTLSPNGKTYHPLVRKSLDVNCHLNITFLRQEDPGALVLQGGDLDGRIKTLFDALSVPTSPGNEAKYPQAQDPTYCLLESDALVSGFDVSTGRLLLPQTTNAHEVHMIVEVTVRVLRLGPWNACLAGH